MASIFLSYRRTQRAAVESAAALLRAAGADVFLDTTNIETLASFPEEIRRGISEAHAMLVWYSADYPESEYCMDEFRIGWQHARRLHAATARRVWLVNPEVSTGHVIAGDLSATQFLRPPSGPNDYEWARNLVDRARLLVTEGTLGSESSESASPPWSSAPRASTHFVGRRRHLWAIHTLLHPARIGPAVHFAGVHIHGLAGIGKTQLAMMYASEFFAAYPGGVFWLNMARYEPDEYSRETAATAWIEAVAAAAWDHPGKKALLGTATGEIGAVRARIADYLQANASLWILDNVPALRPDDARDELLSLWRGPGPHARTVITTRDGRPFQNLSKLELDALDPGEGLRLLTSFREPRFEELDIAKALVNEMGGHALALAILGHRLERAASGYAEVAAQPDREAVVTRLEELAEWGRTKLGLGSASRGIMTTFDTSLQSLTRPALIVLVLASVLQPNVPIPLSLLGAAYRFSARGSSADDFAAAAAELHDASLLSERVTVGNDRRASVVHPLTAAVTLALAGIPRSYAINVVTEAVLVENAEDLQSVLPHVVHILKNPDSRAENDARLMIRFGAAGERFSTRFAVDDVHAILASVYDTLGVEHPYVIGLCQTLAQVSINAITDTALVVFRGDSDALANAERAAECDAHILSLSPSGVDHPKWQDAQMNLASSLKIHWGFGGPDDLLTEALQLEREVVQSSESGDVFRHALFLSALASTHWCLGDLDAAEEIERQLLALDERRAHDFSEQAEMNLRLIEEARQKGSIDLEARGPRTCRVSWSFEDPRTLLELLTCLRDRTPDAVRERLQSIAIANARSICIGNGVASFSGNYHTVYEMLDFVRGRADGREYFSSRQRQRSLLPESDVPTVFEIIGRVLADAGNAHSGYWFNEAATLREELSTRVGSAR